MTIPVKVRIVKSVIRHIHHRISCVWFTDFRISHIVVSNVEIYPEYVLDITDQVVLLLLGTPALRGSTVETWTPVRECRGALELVLSLVFLLSGRLHFTLLPWVFDLAVKRFDPSLPGDT